MQLEQAQGRGARPGQLNDAKVNLERYQALLEEKVIAKQQLDTQAAPVGQFEGAIRGRPGAIDNAKLQLDLPRITAPIAAASGLRQVDVGNIVHADRPERPAGDHADPAHRGAVHHPRRTTCRPCSRSCGRRDLPVEAYDRDDAHQIATGKLLTIDNQIDPTTGTFG